MTPGPVWHPRPSAYALVPDPAGRLAIMRTPLGHFLPGGGSDPAETPEDTVVREAREEGGLVVRPGGRVGRAIEFVYSVREARHFEKRCTFLRATITGTDVPRVEADHELRWVDVDAALRCLTPPTHRWAVERWVALGG